MVAFSWITAPVALLFIFMGAQSFVGLRSHCSRRQHDSRVSSTDSSFTTENVAQTQIDSGDDSFFILPNDFGVFDGVGGYRDIGYEPRKFSQMLCESVAYNITSQRLDWHTRVTNGTFYWNDFQAVATYKGVNLKSALEYGFANTIKKVAGGGSTVCLASFDPLSGLLSGLNLGDSGLLVLRKDIAERLYIVYRTKSQLRNFNEPFQLGTSSTDSPRSAMSFHFYLKENDIVIMATDGLFDNMFGEDIVKEITLLLEENNPAYPSEMMAAKLIEKSTVYSLDKKRLSPWQHSARKAQQQLNRRKTWMQNLYRWMVIALGGNPPLKGTYEGPEFEGGKMDDITVIIAIVKKSTFST